MESRIQRMPWESAERIAISGLAFIAGETESLGRFLAETGLGPENLRSAAGEPWFLCAVLEFLMANEDLLLVFVERIRVRPTMIAAAHLALSEDGGDVTIN